MTKRKFKKQPTIYALQFADPELEGLEVQVKSINSGRLLRLMRLADLATEASQRRNLTENDIAAIDALFEGFGQSLVEWNLTDDDDNDVPANLDGIKAQEFDFTMTLINAWITAVAGVGDRLGKGSNSGEASQEQLIPME